MPCQHCVLSLWQASTIDMVISAYAAHVCYAPQESSGTMRQACQNLMLAATSCAMSRAGTHYHESGRNSAQCATF